MTEPHGPTTPLEGSPAPLADGSADPGSGQKRRLQDDPRAQQALARKGRSGSPTGSTGAGHAKAAQESSKQGKKEKKVRW